MPKEMLITQEAGKPSSLKLAALYVKVCLRIAMVIYSHAHTNVSEVIKILLLKMCTYFFL